MPIEEPLVGSEIPMEPHRVIEAGHLHRTVNPRKSVGKQGGVEERHVARVGGDARVQYVVVGQSAIGAKPDSLTRKRLALPVKGVAIAVPLIDGARSLVPITQLLAIRLHSCGEVRQCLRVGSGAIVVDLVFQPLLVTLKTRVQVEDCLSVLDCNDATGGETRAVANAVDLVEDGHALGACAKKIGVERVDAAIRLVNRARRCDECLSRDLASEHSLAVFIRWSTAEDVDFDLLEVEQMHEIVEGAGHGSMLARSDNVRTMRDMDPFVRSIAIATKGFMPPEEGDALWTAALDAARRVPSLPFVEVGSYCGRSTVWLGAAARSCGRVVHAVDHHGGSEENQPGWEWHDPSLIDPNSGRLNTLPHFRLTISRAGLSDVVVEELGESTTVAARFQGLAALVFIDGGHGREVARADWLAWSPRVSPGGLLAIHDVFENPSDGGQAPFEEIHQPAIRAGFVEVSRHGSLRVLVAPTSRRDMTASSPSPRMG